MCMIRLHLHIGAVALIGPVSELPLSPPDGAVDVDVLVSVADVSIKRKHIKYNY